MTEQTFKGNALIESMTFSVREDHTLLLKTKTKKRTETLVFHDFIDGFGKRYYLFNHKTEITKAGNTVVVRAATVSDDDGAPIPGLLATYRFTLDEKAAAVYASVSLGSDVYAGGYTMRLMDVSWEGFTATEYTGYEYDAAGKPFSKKFSFPTEENPQAPDYETLMRIRPHVAWERMKTRPIAFQKGISIEGKDGYFAVFGGSPILFQEAGFVRVLGDFAAYKGDIRFLSGKNSPGAWFFFEESDDFFALTEELNERIPALPEQVMAPFVEETVPVRAGDLAFNLERTDSGVWIAPVFADKETAAQSMPLFTLTLWDTFYEKNMRFDAGAGWDRVHILRRENYLRVTLADPDSGTIRGITVVAEATLDEKKSRISWKMRVINQSERYSVAEVSYPQCVAEGFDTAYAAVGSGILSHHFNERSSCIRGKYPTGVQVNMPYFAMYNPKTEGDTAPNGIYMGIHDADGNPKFLTLVGAPQSRCTMFTTECTADYQRKPGNSYTLPGEMVWQRFSGDWFDATNIYKEFVLANAKWLAPLRGRPDTPEWMRNMPVWIMHFMPNENPDANPFPITLREKYADASPDDWYKIAVRFREEIGVPVCYHLYNWHWVPFNNDNPNYFPAHQDLKAGMKELKAADIRVIPYMAGYSWDMCDDRAGDRRFQREALPATAKNIDGNSLFTSYASTEPDGKPVRFARMCPSTTTWKNEIQRIVKKLSKDYGMDGIYLDVVSTAYEECFDETHLHTPGFSSFWWKSYAQLIDVLRASVPDDFAIVSESTSEVYSGMLDGYLSWTWVQVDGVPAHSQIYGGRTAIFGRVITQNKRDDADYFRFQIGQSLVFGQQLGWIHPEIVNDPVQFPFLKKMANLRYKYRDFFAEAEMLRPPMVTGDVPLLDCESFLRAQMWNHEKLVVAGTWEDQAKNRRMFAVNASAKTVEVTLSVPEDEYRLPEKAPAFADGEGIEIVSETSENGMRKLELRIAPEGFGVMSWTL
ncbi:MAG: hypothetical protein IKB87_00515 [Clostridia bacterium]|nr:hypothetical protein [Clostridia bacterium]